MRFIFQILSVDSPLSSTITFLFHYVGKIRAHKLINNNIGSMSFMIKRENALRSPQAWIKPTTFSSIFGQNSKSRFYVDSPIHDSFIHKHSLFAFAVIIFLNSRAHASLSDALSSLEHYSVLALWYYHV